MKIGLIILAAGFSERMGVLKPLLPVGGESALHRAVSLGRHEKVHCISVVTGYRSEDIETELSTVHAKNIRHVRNKHYAEGMLTSVKAGVHSLPTDLDGFLLLPVDLCAVRPETIDKLIAAFILENGKRIIYPSHRGNYGHPPLIPYAFAAGLKDYDGEDGMRGYLSQFPADAVETQDAGTLLDMDTPEDYAALLRHLGLPVYPDEAACRQLMEKYAMPENIAAHCRQVNGLALRLSRLLREKGVHIDDGLLSSACLLHDIARLEPEHAGAGAKLLLKEGFPETAMLVASHMDLPADYVPRADALALLFLADKLSRDGAVMPLEETRAVLRARFADDPEALRGAERRLTQAQAIQDMLLDKYGITYQDFVAGAE